MANIKNSINRRERKAARNRDYTKAAYYAADHDYRWGLRVWTIATVVRSTLDLGRQEGKK
jgi:hypothetical protein